MAGKIPVGIQLYSLRTVIGDDVPGTLKKISEMGYECVEFAGYYDLSGAELSDMLKAANLTCAGSHTGLPTLEGDAFDKTVEINKAVGNDRLIIPGANFEDLKATLDRFNAIHEQAKAAGMKAGFHNHKGEFDIVDGKTILDHIFENTPADFLMQIDIGWAAAAGQDVATVLRKYKDRIETVHVKEFLQDKPEAVVGEGSVDWPPVLDLMESELSVQAYVVEQEAYEIGPLESAKGCIDNLRKMGR